MKQKFTFKMIFLGLAIILMLLPIFAALNSFLTKILDTADWYRPIQEHVVPWEAKLVSAAVYPLGIETRVTAGPTRFAFYMVKNDSIMPVDLSWNCLGWQSFLLFFASCLVGLRGPYTRQSKIQTLVFGFLGTFLVNLFRLVFTAALVGWWRGLFLILFHNYFSAFITIAWLILFWYFSYSFVLEGKGVKNI